MNIDRKSFFDGFRAFLVRNGKTLTQARVEALQFQLDCFESDRRWFDRRHIAYAIATECIETDWTFSPIQEYGTYARFERLYGSDTRKGRELGNDAPGEGAAYSGKGLVQITGETNFERAEAEIRKQYPHLVAEFEARTGRKFDLTVGDGPDDAADPENAKEPHLAFAIMTLGMHQGWFTGKKLSDYINVDACDYVHARRVINGLDRAAEIASYAQQIEQILNSAAAPVVKPASEGTVSGAIPNDPLVPPEIEPPPTNSPQTVVVTPPTVPLYMKVAAVFTFLTGLGFNAATLIQQKLTELTPKQLLYCLAALGLCYFAVELIRRERKAKTQQTNLLIEKAADMGSNTVELKK